MIKAEYVRLISGVGRRRRVVLDDVSLTIPAGTITTVLGASGSGKSALMEIMAGLETMTSGSLVVDGIDLATASSAEREGLLAHTYGVLFPRENLLPALTLAENLDLPAKLNGVRPAPEERTRMTELFGLAQVLDQYPDAVPLLEQQKCALAALVLSGRTILLCDEPADGLPQCHRKTLFALLRVCTRELGLTVVTFTSNPISAVSSDLVYLLSDSQIVGELRSPTLDSIIDTLRVLFDEVL